MAYLWGMHDQHLARRIGALVRQYRLDKGVSQEELANLCGLHRTYIGSIERGEKMITIETASKLVSSLGITLSQFFTKLESEDTYNDHNSI
jgi:transcriptional regulator with XRE-family HTH domain